MKKYTIILCFAATSLLLGSCTDFLSERPTKSSNIVPSTVADMESILAGMWRNDCISSNLVYAGGMWT